MQISSTKAFPSIPLLPDFLRDETQSLEVHGRAQGGKTGV